MKPLTDFGLATMRDRYLLDGETPQDMYRRVAAAYSYDEEHRDRLVRYMEDQWFTPSTPILANGGTDRGLPISCYLNTVEDNMKGILDNANENFWLAAKGGGIGTYYGSVREIGSRIGTNGKSSGVIPFMHWLDSQSLAVSQGSLRRGSAAIYLDVEHPEIEEFLEIRKPSGDFNRKATNLHHGVCLSDEFMWAVKQGRSYELKSPKTGPTGKFLDARTIWAKILEIRLATGEPYLLFTGNANMGAARSPVYKKLGLKVQQSNLCAEIMLHTGPDPFGQERTAVCCLASLNAATFGEWQNDVDLLVKDVLLFLDRVLQDFIERAPPEAHKAVYAAIRERSVGLGLMGWHTFLQSINVPFGGLMAKSWNRKLWGKIGPAARKANHELATLLGPCPDAAQAGVHARFANTMAVAPTASVSILCGGGSAGIEPIPANVYTHKTLSGSFEVRNPHLDAIIREHAAEQSEENWSAEDYNSFIESVWVSIADNRGSVQHLEWLTDHEKEVFQTAQEIDQLAIVEQAADRQNEIDQGQSVNLFLPADVHKGDLHGLHFKAWELGVKALYYLRSTSAQSVDFDPRKYEECSACQ